MNEDLARSLDDLLSWLDRRYTPEIRRTLTPRQYTSQWEIDKMVFREKMIEVLGEAGVHSLRKNALNMKEGSND